MTPLTPDAVMAQIATALPQECRQDVIIIGSLAAGYHFFSGDGQRSIRTKDVDCMFAPHARAVSAAGQVICNRGLLASMEVGREAFAATGRRVIQQVVEPLAETVSFPARRI